jgi:hypothetical protein
MAVSEAQPYGHPAAQSVLTITVKIGGDIRTPADALRAINQSFGDYGATHKGTLTPFDQQPGFPAGPIWSDGLAIVGDWSIHS